jgi:hypothetical protein
MFALENHTNTEQMVAASKAADINNLFIVFYDNARTTFTNTMINNLIGIAFL